jgi:predicted secreted protein
MLSQIFTFIAIYLVVWWTVLFAILPLGTTTYAEAGIEVTDGGDPGAPIDPKLGRKAFTTTWVSAIVYAIGWAVWHFHLVHLPSLPSG